VSFSVQIWSVADFIVAVAEVLLPRRSAMKPSIITLAGTIEKLIDRSLMKAPQEAQIAIVGAGHLYDELRIPNTHGWEAGRAIELTIRLL
jgi:hypothetical protein